LIKIYCNSANISQLHYTCLFKIIYEPREELEKSSESRSDLSEYMEVGLHASTCEGVNASWNHGRDIEYRIKVAHGFVSAVKSAGMQGGAT
jgi:hypothetical protein